jgi:hypothetical protein
MEKEFIDEYEKLCMKYKMSLHSCGCCSSPYLVKWGESEMKLTYLSDYEEVLFKQDNT